MTLCLALGALPVVGAVATGLGNPGALGALAQPHNNATIQSNAAIR
ncbi:MAG TPA: hypothetical protein VGG89_04535 [Candidatus Baltobacteraceae bacterium]